MNLTLEWHVVAGVTSFLHCGYEEFPLCDHMGDVWRNTPGELFALRAGAKIAEEIQEATEYDIEFEEGDDEVETFEELQEKIDAEFSRLMLPSVDVKQRWLKMVDAFNASAHGKETSNEQG